MRRQIDAPIRLFNGLDGEYLATINEIPKSKKHGISLRITEKYRPQTSGHDICLYAAPIKRAHFDYLIQKATELGAHTIQPILTARCHVKEIKLERLHAIAIEAAEQSERLTIPTIHSPLHLNKVIEDWDNDRLPIICAEFGQAQPASTALNTPLAQKSIKTGIFTGPEGGFTAEEIELFNNLDDILPIRLGPRILRADTAAIAALACWQALCGDWKGESDYEIR